MPVYLFRCTACGLEQEALRRLGDTEGGPCPDCGGRTRLRPSRVAVRYQGWGFTATDDLVADTRGKDFKALRDKADEVADS